MSKPKPRIGCSVLIEHEENVDHFLLVQETAEGKDGLFGLPGGGLKIEELIPGAAVRETEEETGLKEVILGGIVGLYQRPRTEKGNNHLSVVYGASSYFGEPSPSIEHPEVDFFSTDAIREMASAGLLRNEVTLMAVNDYMERGGCLYPLDLLKICGALEPVTDLATIRSIDPNLDLLFAPAGRELRVGAVIISG